MTGVQTCALPILPFDEASPVAVVMMQVHDALPSPQEKNPEISDEITTLIEKMMAKKKNLRQQDWKEVINDVDLVLEGEFPSSAVRIIEKNGEPQDPTMTRVEPAPELVFDDDVTEKYRKPLPKTTIPNPGSTDLPWWKKRKHQVIYLSLLILVIALVLIFLFAFTLTAAVMLFL